MQRHASTVNSPDAFVSHEKWKKSLFADHCAPGATELLKPDLIAVFTKLHIPPTRADEIFAKVDENGDGKISYAEFSRYVDGHEAELRSSFAALDINGSGTLSRDEISQLLDRQQMSCSPERLNEVFDRIDTDKSGSIDYEEYRAFFALLDPDDLLRSLSDTASFGDEPAGLVADAKSLFRRASVVNPAAVGTPPLPAAAVAAPTSWAHRLVGQLLPGGMAGMMAQSFVQPVETLKVRLQVESTGTGMARYKTMGNAFRLVVAEEGVGALWKGMLPAACRELSYSTLRFGLYKPIKAALGAGTPRDTPLWKMVAAGGAAGGVASFIANPTDLLKTRMQNDASGSRSMFSHAGDIYRASGVLGFWRGATTTVVRAVVLGAVKMASYDQAKIAAEDYLGLRKGTTSNTVLAGLVVSGNVVACTAPADFLRTQQMTSTSGEGIVGIASKAVRTHGPLVLWRGWVLQYMRVLPYGVLQFTFMEQIATMMGSSMT